MDAAPRPFKEKVSVWMEDQAAAANKKSGSLRSIHDDENNTDGISARYSPSEMGTSSATPSYHASASAFVDDDTLSICSSSMGIMTPGSSCTTSPTGSNVATPKGRRSPVSGIQVVESEKEAVVDSTLEPTTGASDYPEPNLNPITTADSSTIILFEEGDALLSLETTSPEHKTTTYQVSSQILSMASLYFREAGRSHNWRTTIALTDDDPDMLLLALRMLHHQYSLLPDRFTTFQQVVYFAVIVDKYQLLESVYPPVLEWIKIWKGAKQDHWIYVAHVFDFREDVEEAVGKLIFQISDCSVEDVTVVDEKNEGDEKKDGNQKKEGKEKKEENEKKKEGDEKKEGAVLLHPRLPTSITHQIRHERAKKIKALKDCIQEIKATRTRKGQQICKQEDGGFCDIVQLGHFMRTVISLELGSQSRLWEQSLDYISEVLERIEPLPMHTPTLAHGSECVWVKKLDGTVIWVFGQQKMSGPTVKYVIIRSSKLGGRSDGRPFHKEHFNARTMFLSEYHSKPAVSAQYNAAACTFFKRVGELAHLSNQYTMDDILNNYESEQVRSNSVLCNLLGASISYAALQVLQSSTSSTLHPQPPPSINESSRNRLDDITITPNFVGITS